MRKKGFSLMLAVIMLLGMFPSNNSVLATERQAIDVTDRITVDNKYITQNGVEIVQGGTIDVSKEVRFNMAMRIKVKGDYIGQGLSVEENAIVQHGDTASFVIAENLVGVQILDDQTMDFLSEDNIKVGEVIFRYEANTLKANITFNGNEDIFKENYKNVKFSFSGRFYLGKLNIGQKEIFEKNYELAFTPEMNFQIEKELVAKKKDNSGVHLLEKENYDNRNLEWKVVVTATENVHGVDVPMDLAGYQLEEIFSKEVNKTTGAFKTMDLADSSSNKIKIGDTLVELVTAPTVDGFKYTFPANSVSPQEIRFYTAMTELELFVSQTPNDNIFTKKNTVQLLNQGGNIVRDKENKEVRKSIEVKVRAMDLFRKFGQDSSMPYDINGGKKFRFEWHLVSNLQYIKGLKDLKLYDNSILDDLPTNGDKHTKIISAKWQIPDPNDSAWNNIPLDNPFNVYQNLKWIDMPGEPVLHAVPAESKYFASDMNGPRRLVITVEANIGMRKYDYYTNVFYPRWEGITNSNNRTVSAGVYLGSKFVKKRGLKEGDALQIKWQLEIMHDRRQGKVPQNLLTELSDPVMYDFLPFKKYDKQKLTVKNATGSSNQINGVPISETITSIESGNLSFQKYHRHQVVSGDVDVKVHSIYNDDVHVADLLEFKPATSAAKDMRWDIHVWTESAQADRIFHNGRGYFINGATVFDGTRKVDESRVGSSNNLHMLDKEMIPAREWFPNRPITIETVNKKTKDAKKGYHHAENAVIYRISINKSKFLRFKDLFGGLKLTDTLPDNWEFTPITEGRDFLVYKGKNLRDWAVGDYSVEAVGEALTDAELNDINLTNNAFIGTKEAVIEIKENIDSPYVILLKARPKQDTILKYIDSANHSEITVKNIVKMEAADPNAFKNNANHILQVEQDVTFNPWTIKKSHDGTVDKDNRTSTAKRGSGYGALIWTVDYMPRETNLQTVTFEDTLTNQSFRVENGVLQLTGKIRLLEFDVNGDGSFRGTGPNNEGTKIEWITDGVDKNIELLNQGNQIRVKITPKPYKGYRLEYLADFDGNHALGKSVSNTITLKGTALTETVADYIAGTYDAKATFDTFPVVEVIKVDEKQKELKGAVFAVFEGAAERARVTTNNLGNARFTNLERNRTYTLREVTAPEGYLPDDTTYRISIDNRDNVTITNLKTNAVINGKQVIVINRNRNPISVEVVKEWVKPVAEHAKPVTIRLMRGNEASPIAEQLLPVGQKKLTFTTDKNNQVLYEKDADGNIIRYRVEEVAVDGYTSESFEKKTENGNYIKRTENAALTLVDTPQGKKAFVKFVNTFIKKPEVPVAPFEPEKPKEESKPEPPKEEPKPQPEPEPQPQPEPKPEEPAEPTPEPEPTPIPREDIPTGVLEIPDGDVPKVVVPPKNGKFEFDGHTWRYIPNPNFYGKDKIELKITRPDGSEYEEVILIDIPIPEGDVTLPQTDGIPAWVFVIGGLGLFAAALWLKRKNRTAE